MPFWVYQISGYIMSLRLIIGDINLNRLVKVVVARILRGKLIISLFLITKYFRGGTLRLCR